MLLRLCISVGTWEPTLPKKIERSDTSSSSFIVIHPLSLSLSFVCVCVCMCSLPLPPSLSQPCACRHCALAFWCCCCCFFGCLSETCRPQTSRRHISFFFFLFAACALAAAGFLSCCSCAFPRVGGMRPILLYLSFLKEFIFYIYFFFHFIFLFF